MKRFTKLIVAAAAMLLPLSSYADGFTVATESTPVGEITEGYFVLKCKYKGTERTVYSVSADGYQGEIKTSNTATGSVSDKSYVWYVTQTTNGIVIQNAGTGAYIPRQSEYKYLMEGNKSISNAAFLIADATNITDTYKMETNAVTLHQISKYRFTSGDGLNGSADVYIHGDDSDGNPLSYWQGGSYTSETGSIMQFAFYKVTTTDDFTSLATPSYAVAVTNTDGTITYSAELANQDISTNSNNAKDGTSSSSERSYWFTATDDTLLPVKEPDTKVSRTNVTFTATGERSNYTEGENMPFKYYTEENPTLYTINFRNNDADKKYLVYSSGDNISSVSKIDTISTFSVFKGALWGFVKDGYGVKLLCYQNGEYVKVDGTTNGAKATFASTESDATTFIGLTNTYGSSCGFTLKVKGVDRSVIGDHANSNLGIWKPNDTSTDIQNDGGSSFHITSADDASVLTIAKNIFKTQANAETQTDYSSYGNLVVNRSYWNDNNTAAQNATKCVDILNLAEKSETKPNFDPTAYYTIKCCDTKGAYKYLSSEKISMTADGNAVASDGTSTKLYHVSDTTAIPHRLFQIPADGQIKSVNTGFFLNGADGLVSTAPTDKFSFSIVDVAFKDNNGTNDKTSMFRLKFGSSEKYINAFKGTEMNYEIGEWSDDNDPSNFWQFTKVTEIPVTISTIGYASVCLPVPVTLSQDGITAYIVTGNNGSTLTLEEIASGTVIPAGTGFLVASGSTEEKTATFTIASEAGTALTNNLMEGVNARRTGLTAQENYVLTKGSDGKAVFRIYDLTAMPANKAYLKISKMTNSEGIMAFNFDNQVTGIDAATTTPDAETYYDLNGRRVLYPAHGIYVKSNGQKVFIK